MKKRIEKRYARGAQRFIFIQLIATLLLVCFSVASLSAQQPATQPAAPPSGQVQRMENLQDVVAKQAALVTEFDVNGLKVLMKRREGSLTVAAGLFILGGVRNVTPQNAGIESLMLSAATEASTNYPRERMRVETSRMATVVSSSVNYDYSVLSLACTRPNFDKSWDMFADVALRPSFTKDDVGLTQSRMVAALQDDTDDPDTYLQRLQEKVAYANHPYSNRAEGSAETIARLTPEDLRASHQKLMETSRLLLIVVGDLDPAQVKAKVAASFGKLARGNYKPSAVPALTFDRSTVEITSRDLPTNYIQGVFTAPALTSPDIYPMRVAAAILRDRVFEEVRVKRNLSYAPNAFLGGQAANIGGIYVTAVDANQATQVMLDEMTRLQREPISQDDIKSVVAQYLTSYYMGQETNSAQAADLAQWEIIGGGWRNSTEFINRLRAVTPADVQRV